MRTDTPSSDSGLGLPDEWIPDLTHTVCHATQTILGWAELLATEGDAEYRQHAIDSIVSSAQHISRSVQALSLALGDVQADKQPFDIREALVSSMSGWGSREPHNADLQLVVPDLPDVLCDTDCMQALMMLLLSHFRFSARAGSVVVVDGEALDDAVALRISGHRVEFSGLIAKVTALLADRAGATVAVSSSGETRSVEVRVGRLTESRDDDALRPGSWVVLHLDDDLATRELVSAVLTSERVSVVSVGSLDEARRIMQVSSPDLLVLDGRVGVDDGLDLLREVRKGDSNPAVAAIVLSAQHTPERQEAAAELGALTLHKPIPPSELAATVEETLSTW